MHYLEQSLYYLQFTTALSSANQLGRLKRRNHHSKFLNRFKRQINRSESTSSKCEQSSLYEKPHKLNDVGY